MQLDHIELGKLRVSAANMRAGKRPPDISDILPSVRARGVLVPLLVRPDGDAGSFEIVAGRRRFFAAAAIAGERLAAGEPVGPCDPLPCAIIEAGDDAAALEASLIENVARVDAHEVDQWETFTRLVAREGRKPQEIAATFGLTTTMVKRVLALGNLLPGIRALYRKEEIDAVTVRSLTMATKRQQKEWLAMRADPTRRAPTGHSLKSWLFGGASIPTSLALFDLASYPGAIVADLFGEGGYFADADQFWAAQREAVEAKCTQYLEAGWVEVVTLEPGSHFNSWEYEKTPRSKNGRVYAALSERGEVTFHEGYLSRKEARRIANGEGGEPRSKAARPEVTGTMQTYIELHRHAAVRAELVDHPAVALRLMAAHAICGSCLFSVRPDPQRGASNAVTTSDEKCAAQTAFDRDRRKVLGLLGFDPDTPNLVGGRDPSGTAGLFVRLLSLSDEEVLEVVAIVMGESLESGSAAVEAAGVHPGVDMARYFAPDETLFELIRDKEVLSRMIAELAGEAAAEANAEEKTKIQKAVVRDCLAGENGRTKVENWVPRWMAFPPSAYTERGGVGAVRRSEEIAGLFAPEADADAEPNLEPTLEPEPKPEAPQSAAAVRPAGDAVTGVAPVLDAGQEPLPEPTTRSGEARIAQPDRQAA